MVEVASKDSETRVNGSIIFYTFNAVKEDNTNQ